MKCCKFVFNNLPKKQAIMKKGLLFMAIAAFAFTSCDKVANIENFAVGNNFEKVLKLDVPATGPMTYAEEFAISTDSDPDFKDNLSKISGYTVKNFTYRIGAFTGDGSAIGSAVCQFVDGTNPIGDPISISAINFEAQFNSGDVVEIPVSNDLRLKIEDQLLNNNFITIKMGGAVTAQPMTADFVVGMEVEALVKVQ